MKIQIFQIKVNEGRRVASPEAVHDLADSISKVGMINPITVDKDYTLIAGLHRLEAAKLLGWAEIECNVSDLDGLMAELAEIDENLIRCKLHYTDEGKQLTRRKEIYEMLHPESKNGGNRRIVVGGEDSTRTKPFRSGGVKPFSVDTAEKIGTTRRTVEQKIQVAKRLTPKTAEVVKEHNIGFKNALKLSRLAPEYQEAAVKELVDGKIHSVDEYQSVPAESKSTAEQDSEAPDPPPEDLAPSAPKTGYYPTVRDSIADLKNPDKDRSLTPSSFLVTFSLFLQRFRQSVKSYAVNEYAPVFPALSREQLDQLQGEISSVHTTLDDLFNIIKRKVEK